MWLLEKLKLHLWVTLYFEWTVLNLCKKVSLLHFRQSLMTKSSVLRFFFTFSTFYLDYLRSHLLQYYYSQMTYLKTLLLVYSSTETGVHIANYQVNNPTWTS